MLSTIVSFMAQTEKENENENKKKEITDLTIVTVFLASIALAVATVALVVFCLNNKNINSYRSELDSVRKDVDVKLSVLENKTKVPIVPSRPVPEAKFIPGDKIMPENKMVEIPIYPRQAPSTLIELLKSNAKTAEYYVGPAVHYEPVANEQPTASLTLFTDQKTV